MDRIKVIAIGGIYVHNVFPAGPMNRLQSMPVIVVHEETAMIANASVPMSVKS